MDFSFSEEQEELGVMARSFLADASDPEKVRDVMQTPLGYDAEVWNRIGTELGWCCVHIPEEYGGLGLGFVDLAVLLEATGESVLCAPFFSTVALGANTILECGTEAQKQERLPAIAEGTHTATLAFAEASGQWDADGISATATPDGDGFVLNGTKAWVVDGHSADLVLVVARAPGTTGEDGLSVFAVDGDADGVSRKMLTTMDQTRRIAEIELSAVRVSADACLGEPGAAWPGLRRTLDLAAIALAAEQVGGAQKCLDLSVAYAKEREQFGRPIGSFQSLKHKCADMMIAVESARSATPRSRRLGVPRRTSSAQPTASRFTAESASLGNTNRTYISKGPGPAKTGSAIPASTANESPSTWSSDPHARIQDPS